MNCACGSIAYRCAITTQENFDAIHVPSKCLYTQYGRTPLSWACENGLNDIALLLIDKGADMDVTDEVSYHNESKLNRSCHLIASTCRYAIKVYANPKKHTLVVKCMHLLQLAQDNV